MTTTARPAPAPTRRNVGHGGPNFILSLLPWIAIWILSGHHTFRLGMAIGLIVSVVLIAWQLIEGVHPKLLEWWSLVAIAAITILAFTANPGWLATWLNVITSGALFLIMAGSIVIGRPFTASYAHDTVPREYWDSAIFRRTTLGIAVVWSLALLAMTIGAIVTTVRPSAETWSTWVVTIVALVAAFKFQAWYPDHVKHSQ